MIEGCDRRTNKYLLDSKRPQHHVTIHSNDGISPPTYDLMSTDSVLNFAAMRPARLWAKSHCNQCS